MSAATMDASVSSSEALDESVVETSTYEQLQSSPLIATVDAASAAQSSLENLPTANASVTPPLNLTTEFPSPEQLAGMDAERNSLTSSADSTSRSDLGLLAWLATSSNGDQPHSDTSFSDSDFSISPVSDEPATLDAVFELLEGSAVATAAV